MLWPPALRGVFSLNPKITKLLAEREKNSEKIAKLTAMQTARPSGPQSAAPVEKEDADHEET